MLIVFGRGGCVWRGGAGDEDGLGALGRSSAGTAISCPPLTERARSDPGIGIGIGEVSRGESPVRDALRSSTFARISAKVARDGPPGVGARRGSRSPASGASAPSFSPTESLRRRAQLAPHLRIASLAWIPIACLSAAAALAFRVLKKLEACEAAVEVAPAEARDEDDEAVRVRLGVLGADVESCAES
jgi:hypothetical protein